MNLFEKAFEYIGMPKVLYYSEELIGFYFRPLRFFERFFSQTLLDKVIQTAFYALIIIILGYILILDITIRELIKMLVFEIGILVIVVCILGISNYCNAKIQRKSFNLENLIFFIIIAKLLLAPFQVICYSIFISYENYNFFLLGNLVVAGLFIYIYIFSARVFNSKIGFILLNIFFNLLIMNIVLFGLDKLSLDNYSTFETPYYTDQILKERLEKGTLIANGYTIPAIRVIVKSEDRVNESYFLFSYPLDSIATGSSEQSIEYQQNLLSDLSRLDTLIPSLRFERNKVFFQKVQSLYRLIDTVMNEAVITYTNTNIIKSTSYLDVDSVAVCEKIFLGTSEKIRQHAYDIIEDQADMENKSYAATLPLFVFNYVLVYQIFFPDEDIDNI